MQLPLRKNIQMAYLALPLKDAIKYISYIYTSNLALPLLLRLHWVPSTFKTISVGIISVHLAMRSGC